MKPECSVVVPLCNEERNLPTLHLRLTATLCKLAIPYEIIYVDDGSTDETPRIIAETQRADARVRGLFLSRNFGHQAALCAGLDAAAGRAIVSIDGDLQDPPELIARMIEKWHEGYHVVYARRRRRKDNPLKLFACHVYYRLLRWASDITIPLDTGDYALMDRQALDQLNAMPERTRFIRGLRSWVGFRQTEVEYDRDPRRDGESKYPFGRLLRLGLDGLVGFSDKPIKAIASMGVMLTIAALIGCVAGAMSLVRGGNATVLLMSLMTVFGGVQLLALGVVGEYISRIYNEVRGRPLYLIRERIGFNAHPRPVPKIAEYLDTQAAHRHESATALRLKRTHNDKLAQRDEITVQ
ncbi:MAG: glycosyltransferase family 2 protein [Phycisphaerales bacterium]|nr:glycosyltransferase family 2 protein [Phycisphaerales bacterium]